MNESQPWDFTCKTCGNHRLTVSRIWLILAGLNRERWQEWGPLKANHLWRFKFREKLDKEIDQNNVHEVKRWDFVEYTENASSSKPEEENKRMKRGSYPGGDKFYVNCADCNREIEFGWSQPNRRGRIYPVECSDFVPENIWPEPRYLEFWRQNNWHKKDDKHV